MNPLKSLLTTLLLAAATAGAAQTDVTGQYLSNADFADGAMEANAPRGWTLELSTSGVQSKISTSEKADGTIAGNQNHWQLWQASGSLAGKACQQITQLPAGRYRVTAVVSATFGGTVELYLNDAATPIPTGKAGTYEAEALIVDGNAELGLALDVTNGGTIDFDSFRLYQYGPEPGDLALLLDAWRKQCADDTLSQDRPAWYNREEMQAAFAASEAAGGDEAGMQAAIGLLETAHRNFQEITAAYATLRDEAAALHAACERSSFALLDSVEQIHSDITAYYSLNEDHYGWVRGTLPLLRGLAGRFGLYQKMSKAISTARNQLQATGYEGREALQEALAEAGQMLAEARTEADFRAGTGYIEAAQASYLKNRPEEWVTIQNGLLWQTDDGATVQAHAPGFVRVGDIWYMCGEDRSNWWNPDVNLYSSTDLVHWKFEKKIIQNGVTTAELGSSRMIERPKLLYNEKTDKFVVWCHYESSDYGASEAASFECDSVNGAYRYVWSGRPLGIKSRDCNVFQDTDGTAYFVSTTEENQHLGLFRLSDDYHEAVAHTQLFPWQRREAPAIVRIGDRYFMFNSACSGWDPNQCKMSYTGNLESGWSALQNVGNPMAYDTQAAAILEIKGTKTTTYLYVGDRWQDPGLPETKTIIFPISFDGTRCTFKYHERFDINFVTGEWRETPVEGHFADKSGWTVTACSSEETASENAPARNAIDGNVNTIWHTRYSGSTASAPHHITIDMGRTHAIRGFLATPRMDDGSSNGLIRKYQLLASMDGKQWRNISYGDWLPYCTEVTFDTYECRYLRLVSSEGTYASLAEFDVVLDPSAATGIDSPRQPAATPEETSRAYFTLDGRPTATPSAGVYIEQIHYADGSSKSQKRIRE